jgi:serine phosphatase RsbU (regulator of sigma subunit)/streptogramin lyase
VIRYDGKNFKSYTTFQGLANNNVRRLYQDRSGTIWLGTDGGLSCFNPSETEKNDSYIFTSYTTLQGLSCNEISGIGEDKAGNIWLSTVSGGVSLYNGKAFTNYTTHNGLANNLVRSILEDEDDNIWFGTDGSGVSCYTGKAFKNYSVLQGLIDNNVWCIYKDKAGNIWFGTDGGVSCFNGKSFINYTVEQGLINNSVRSILEDNNGNMWFGTHGGASCYDGKSFTSYTTVNGLSNNMVKCMLQDKAGNIWFGTYGGGISCFNGKHFVNYTSKQGLAKDIVFCINEDAKGNLWLGTYGGGVCRYDGKSFLSYGKRDGLPDDAVTQIVEASFPAFHSPGFQNNINNKECLVMGTNYGIAVLSGWKDKNGQLFSGSFAEKGKIDLSGLSNEELKNYTPVFEVYNSSTGYPVKDVNAGQNGIYKDHKGIIWIATGSNKTALVRFDPAQLNDSHEPLTVVIQGIKINEENICWRNLYNNKNSLQTDSIALASASAEEVLLFGRTLTGEERTAMVEKYNAIQFTTVSKNYPLPEDLVLPFKYNNLIIDFTAIKPAKFFLIRYQYMLEGYNSEWSPLTDNTIATFGNIPEGSYTFILKAMDTQGIWSVPVMYKFKILPPLYRTWWAYLFYLSFFSSILYTLYRWRTAALRKDKELLEQTVKERTSEIIKQKNIVEEKNTLITDSIEYAKNIQHALLPSEKELAGSFSKYFVLYKPKDIVSGDFYWVHNDMEKIVFAVADCTGHGVPGAFMSLMGNNFLNDIIKVKELHSPSDILEELNFRVLMSLKQNENNRSVKYGMDIALIVLDKEMTTLRYSGAHNSLLIYRSADTGEEQTVCFQIKADRRAIGSIKKNGGNDFINHTFKLFKGDMIYLFTDGFADQMGGTEKKKFFSQSFKNLLHTICQLDVQEQKAVLETTIQDWKGTLGQTDDILVVGIKI